MAVTNKPNQMGKRVAVEIGADLVRAVEVEMTQAGAQLLKRGTAPSAPGYWDDPAANRQKLTQAIRAALSAAGISAAQVVSALPRRMVTIKYARLPHGEPEQIRGMVQFEAQQYVPFPLEDVVLDHQIVSDENDEMTTAMIVAARRSLVDEVLGAFDDAGLEVTRLTVSSLALAEHARGLATPTAMLGVEERGLDLAVVSDGRMLFSRAASVSESAGIPGEVGRSFASYQNEHRATPIGSMLLAGPLATVAQTEERLSGLFDVPVARMNGRMLTASDVGAIEFAGAVGLALGADGSGIGRIDLVPRSRAEKKQAARRRSQGLLVFVAAAAILGVMLLWLTRTMADQKRENAEALKENGRLEMAQKALNRVKSEHDTSAETYRTVSTGLSHSTPVVDLIKAVSDAVPKQSGIYLTQFTIDRTGAVAIHGNAKTESGASDLVLALMGAGPFLDVKLGYLGDTQTETGLAGASATPAQTPAAATPAAPATTADSTKPAIVAKPVPLTSFIITCRVKSNEIAPIKTETKPAAAPKTGLGEQP